MNERNEQRFRPGDRVYDKLYGFGVVRKVNMDDHSFPYYVEYEDGTKIWYRAKKAVPEAEAPPDAKHRRR